MCASGHCALMQDGKPLYIDHHHLSAFGAGTLAPLFAPVFK
jgi:hypothetical protein